MDNNYNEYNNGYNNGTNNNSNTGKDSKFLVGMVAGFLCAVVIAAVAAVIFIKPMVEKIASIQTDELSYEDGNEFMDSVMSKVGVMQAFLEKEYYYEMDYEKAANAMYKGFMAYVGDEYGYYYNEQDFESLTQESTGTYCGIGATVMQDTETGYIKIVKPFKNGPAFEAGIRTNDYITEIAGEDVRTMDLDGAVKIMKGEEGTVVKVKVLREGEELSFDIERRVIEIETVEHEMLEDKIGYIAVSSFEGKTSEHFAKAVDDLVNQGAKGIVVDLRDNGGGLLTAVCEMLDYLLPEGVLVYTEDKDGTKVYERSDAACVDIPMVVLINGNSASASEVFTGAMQDYEAATVVGETSFGKGIVQTVRSLGDGTAIKYTTSAYFTPDGRNIHGTGITPDIEVELPEDEAAYEDGVLKREYDTQLEKAIEVLSE